MIYFVAYILTVAILRAAIQIEIKSKTRISKIFKVLGYAAICFLVVSILSCYGNFFFHSSTMKNLMNIGKVQKLVASKVYILVIVLVLCLFFFLRVFYFIRNFKLQEENQRAQKIESLTTVFFDIAVIPNIFVMALENVLFVLPLILYFVEIGLVLSKTVFSFSKKEIGAWVI